MLPVLGDSPAGVRETLVGETRVRSRILYTAAVMVASCVFVFGGTAQAGRPGTGAIRETTLTEAQVVPGAGDTQGMSESRLIFYPNKHKLCYTIQVSGIARATSAHLHEAPAGQSARRSSG